jgi:hypothetical protein
MTVVKKEGNFNTPANPVVPLLCIDKNISQEIRSIYAKLKPTITFIAHSAGCLKNFKLSNAKPAFHAHFKEVQVLYTDARMEERGETSLRNMLSMLEHEKACRESQRYGCY